MLNSKKLKKDIMQLFAESPNDPYVIGNGILTSVKFGFDKRKLEKKNRRNSMHLTRVRY